MIYSVYYAKHLIQTIMILNMSGGPACVLKTWPNRQARVKINGSRLFYFNSDLI